MKMHLALLCILQASFHAHSAKPLSCDIGPIHTELAASEWQVTSCNDGQSLVFVTMKGNPAMPFMFFIKRDGDKRKITGQGNGAKEYTAKAFAELKSMDRTQYDRLVQATILVGKAN